MTDRHDIKPIIEYQDMKVYADDIQVLTDEYLSTLDNPDMIYKPMVFTGLLEYIYSNLIKNVLPNNKNGLSYDYELLNNIFYRIYVKLCYRFDKSPTILGFTNFCHIGNENISDIKKGFHRQDGSKINQTTRQIVLKWFDTCENGLLSKAVESNGIGAIFGLKALYGYSDNQTITIQQNDSLTHETAEQIAARHSTAQLPEKIDL